MAIDVGTAIAYLDLDTSKFKNGLSSAMTSLTAFTNSSLTVTQRMNALGTSMTSAGSALTKSVTLPLVGLGTAATVVASNFEASMSKVSAISGATGNDLEKLRDKAIEMGAKTKFSASESADAFTYMAMAGWDAAQMVDGIGGIMSLAAADGLDLATTSDIVTDALTAFGLKASDSAHFADVLAQASSSANTNVTLLGESFKYAAPVAGALGMSVEDVSVALGLMANAGIKGSQSGTALRTALTNMVKPSDAMAVKMEELKIEVENADGTMKSLSEIMAILRDRFGKLSEAEQANAAATIFGKEAMSGMLAVINASEEDYNKLADAIANADGRADDMASTMMDNLSGAIEQLKGATESFLIKIGTALTPTIRKIAESITLLVDKLNQLDDAQIQQLVSIAALVAAFGPVLLIVGKVITTISKLSTAFTTLKTVSATISLLGPSLLAVLGPVVAVVAGIVGLIAIFKKLYEENEEFRNKVNEIWSGLVEVFTNNIGSIGESLSFFVDVLKTIPQTLSNTFNLNSDKISGSFITLFKKIKGTVESIIPIVKALATLIGAVLTPAFVMITGVINGLLSALPYIVDWFSSLISLLGNIADLIVSVFTGDFDAAGEAVKRIVQDIVNSFSSAISTIVAFFSGFISGVWETIKNFFSSFGIDLISMLVSVKESIIEFIEVTIPNFINSIITWFDELPYKIGYSIGLIIETIVNFGKEIISWAQESIPLFIETVKTFFDELPFKIETTVTNAYQHIKTWVINMIEKAREMGSKFIQTIIDFFESLPIKVETIVKNTYQKVKTWTTDMVEKAKEMGKSFVDNIITFFTELPGKAYDNLIKMRDKILEISEKLKSAGKDIMNKFLDGLKEAWTGILSWFESVGDKISSFFQGIKDGFNSVASSAASVNRSVSGSHANGLAYVPYNGYVAELHEGERVLTKAETEEYNNGNGSSGDTFIFQSPKKIDEYEAARLLRKTKLELEW